MNFSYRFHNAVVKLMVRMRHRFFVIEQFYSMHDSHIENHFEQFYPMRDSYIERHLNLDYTSAFFKIIHRKKTSNSWKW